MMGNNYIQAAILFGASIGIFTGAAIVHIHYSVSIVFGFTLGLVAMWKVAKNVR